MILRTEVSHTDVSTASEGLLAPAAKLALELETVLRHDLCRLRPSAPVVAHSVGVLQDALAAAHVGRQLHTHLLDPDPGRGEVAGVDKAAGGLHPQLVRVEAALGGRFVNVIVGANRKCEEALSKKYVMLLAILCAHVTRLYQMICHQIYLDLDYLTNFVASGNDTLCPS